ncbi:hypothetical protein KC332_g12117 [Hortaea werneckii]|uniref:Uncharacterized protein n=1 Tax=Hortaea werneckii TaxID=91943 RepID=A0A3M7I8M5_HORWE|nr:hypothetical protein KC329_g14164 [Hortaea werneckii]KAI7262319.1 hypothetical protein KC335_g10332 [Hortaea werneckii]KAI7395691.1 hypothetical protein KC332_g12117 [Hortaea werneckii]KAI7436286.1 hypothetical protein KC368_g13366 [Hortaea werneckii]RMZ21752.1 hypothetical protein D0859_14230 [Hortaea werneckii]
MYKRPLTTTGLAESGCPHTRPPDLLIKRRRVEDMPVEARNGQAGSVGGGIGCDQSAAASLLNATRCRLLELPREIRDEIWLFTVVEWIPLEAETDRRDAGEPSWLQRAPIRIDRFNTPLPPAITRSCVQIRGETLPLYYQSCKFECWRPKPNIQDWSFSTLVMWLLSLCPERMSWLRDVVLLYKHEAELEHGIEEGLREFDVQMDPSILSHRRELSEYEMSYEQLGLPRHFGKKHARR